MIRYLALLALLASTLACSLTAGVPPTSEPLEVIEVGEFSRGTPPPTRTPVAFEPAPDSPTPLPRIDNATTTRPVDCGVPPTWNATYTVQSGDVLVYIAADYGVSYTELAEANCLEDARRIEIGQVLAVPGGQPVAGGTVLTGQVGSPAPSTRVFGAPATMDIYFVSQTYDGRVGGIQAGCGNMLAPLPVTVYGDGSAEGRVQAALDDLFAHGPRYDSADGQVYRNPLSASDLRVTRVSINVGVAQVALRGVLPTYDVCDIPLVHGQILQTVIDDSAVNRAEITINGQPLDAVLPMPR